MARIKKTIFFILSFQLLPNLIFSQYQANLTYGIKVGALYNSISNLPEMLIGSNESILNYTIESKGKYGVEGGLFLNYKLPESRIAIQPEILYKASGEKLEYNSSFKKYNLNFNYSYLVIGALYKLYPLEGLNVGTGAFYSVNLVPSNIQYTSNENDGQYDLSNTQFYKDALEGNDDFSLCFALAYELKKSLHFDLRYYYSLSDAVTTRDASFQFTENRNRIGTLSLSIGYSLHEW